jgi:hypothetical protein
MSNKFWRMYGCVRRYRIKWHKMTYHGLQNSFAFAPFIWHSKATEILELTVDTLYSTNIEKDESTGDVRRDQDH